MALLARLESLQRRHAALESAIAAEESHTYHDENRLHTLKVERLHLKEQMNQLENASNTNRQKWH